LVVAGDAPITVVVGEDQALFREGVIHILQASGFDVVAAAADAIDLVRKTRAHAPDVAVVDIHMPPNCDDDGLRAAQEIRATQSGIGVLVLSQFLEDRYALDLVGDRPEGVGYLLKERVAEVESFTDAVRRVARGGSVIDPDVVGRLVGLRRRHDPIDELTGRELEVLRLIAQGRSNQGIADALVVTVPAVERHVTRIFAKLELTHNGEDHLRVLAVLQYFRR
jgi:DNA-binding NarL/FixJ family response regulator